MLANKFLSSFNKLTLSDNLDLIVYEIILDKFLFLLNLLIYELPSFKYP